MIRKKDHEKLDRKTLLDVTEKINENKITIKEGCQLLNISYNSSRFKKILEEFAEKEFYRQNRRKELRGKPITLDEKKIIVESYLSGKSLDWICELIFRGMTVVKEVLAIYNIPISYGENSYFQPLLNTTEFTEFKEGDLVFSCRYHKPCTIAKLFQKAETIGEYDYLIEFHGNHRHYAYQPGYELMDLTKAQKELNIKLEDLSKEEVNSLLYEAVKASNDQI